ncbi:MAG: hypothetical protein QOE61_3104, partial [Micromonosporaceae bacterium]|nr:hypothetical protein [Micromonosporaceae bacterium]
RPTRMAPCRPARHQAPPPMLMTASLVLAQVSPSVALLAPPGGPSPPGAPSPPAGPGPAEERPLRSPSTGLAVQPDLATPTPPDIAPLADRLAPTMPARRAPRDARRAHASAAGFRAGCPVLRALVPVCPRTRSAAGVRERAAGRLPPHVAVRDVSRLCRHDGAVPKRAMSEVDRVERRLHQVMAVRPRDHAACAAVLGGAVTLVRTVPAGAEEVLSGRGHDRHPDRPYSGRGSAGLVCRAGQGSRARTGRLRGSPRPYRPGTPHLVAAGT